MSTPPSRFAPIRHWARLLRARLDSPLPSFTHGLGTETRRSGLRRLAYAAGGLLAWAAAAAALPHGLPLGIVLLGVLVGHADDRRLDDAVEAEQRLLEPIGRNA